MPTSLPNQAAIPGEGAPETRYAYKASLIGSAHQFELTDAGLSWRIAGRSGVWAYADITAIRLSYRPVSMQSRRFRADIDNADGGRIALLSTTWQTAALMAPQDQDYRAFVTMLHRRMQQAGSRATLVGGLRRVFNQGERFIQKYGEGDRFRITISPCRAAGDQYLNR